ncbi:MAG: MMPL family transporter [Pseudohongiellaceae bacterium]
MATLIRHWADFVLTNRLFILLFSLILLPVMLFTGKPIPFDNTTERYFVAGDPTLADFNVLLDLFGDNEYLIIGIEMLAENADIFNAEALGAIASLTEFLDSHPAVTQVRSLTNFQYTHAEGDDLRTDDLIEDLFLLTEDPALLQQARSTVLTQPLAIGTLVSEDLRHARIMARVEYRHDTAEHKVQLSNDLYDFIANENFDDEIFALHLSGQPLLNERFETLAAEDTGTLIPLMAVVMIVMLLISFRSFYAAMLPWAVISLGVLAVQEIQSYLGFPHTTVDEALIPTLIIIGIGVAVHVMVEYFHLRHAGLDAKAAAHETIIAIWRPALFTAVTTSAGFLALAVTRIVPVRDFAVLGAIGPLVLFFFALTLLPALLSFVNKVPARTQNAINSGIVTRFAESIPDFTQRHHMKIIWIGVALLLFSLFSLSTLRVDTNYVNLFKQDSPVRSDIEYFDRVFQGVMTVEIVLDSGEPEGIKEPGFLSQVEAFQAWIESRESTGAVNSLVDFLKQINQALHGDDPAWYRLPDSPEMTAQYLLLYDSSGTDEDLSDVKDFDNRYLRLTVPIVNMRASDMDAELRTFKSHLQTEYPELQAMLTGGMVLFNTQDMYTGRGMFQSFSIALVVMSLFFIVLFKSFKYGILSIIPSILPILLTGGIIGLAGVNLDLSTMVVGAMTMGIAVDDAIHVMNRYLSARALGASARQSIGRAMHESGRAVIFSSIVLVLGFTVLTFANFVTIIQVGLFGAIIMFLALLGDLLFLPAILYKVDGVDTPASGNLAQ